MYLSQANTSLNTIFNVDLIRGLRVTLFGFLTHTLLLVELVTLENPTYNCP